MDTKYSSSVTTKGQITIPKYIRDHLGLISGSKVTFEIKTDGQVVMTAKAPGSGMNAAIKSQILKMVADGKHVIVIDPENEYRDLSDSLNGKIVTSVEEIDKLPSNVPLIVVEKINEIPLRSEKI